MLFNDSLRRQTERLALRPFEAGDSFLVARILRHPKVAFWRKKRAHETGARGHKKPPQAQQVEAGPVTDCPPEERPVNLLHRHFRLERQDHMKRKRP